MRAARYLRVDALSVVFLLATAFLYAGAAAYAVGYVTPEKGEADFPRYARRFYAGLNVFAASMLAAPLVNGLALLWVAVEVTTVVSALLVAIEDTDEAAEAAWKYVLLASAGLGIALLATIVMYYAGSQVLGASYELTFDPLLAAAGRLPHGAVQLAFVLAVVGFGTKVGLVPLHTWLPDAHSEAPTPVSALLSGSLLVVSFYAVLRYYQVTRAAVGGQFPQTVLLVFGVASLLLAALYLLDQHDVKRLLAYSSVEHMGILAVGVGFGAPLALAGVLLHVLAHAAAKGQRVLRRRGAGPQVRDEVGDRDPRGVGRAAVDRAAVPAGRARAVGVPAVRAVPQRVPDRRRRDGRLRARPDRGAGRAGHGRVPRLVVGHHPDGVPAGAGAAGRADQWGCGTAGRRAGRRGGCGDPQRAEPVDGRADGRRPGRAGDAGRAPAR